MRALWWSVTSWKAVVTAALVAYCAATDWLPIRISTRLASRIVGPLISTPPRDPSSLVPLVRSITGEVDDAARLFQKYLSSLEDQHPGLQDDFRAFLHKEASLASRRVERKVEWLLVVYRFALPFMAVALLIRFSSALSASSSSSQRQAGRRVAAPLTSSVARAGEPREGYEGPGGRGDRAPSGLEHRGWREYPTEDPMSPCATDGAGQGRQTQAGWSTQAHDTAVGPRGPGGALGRVEERARIRAGRQGAEAHLGEVGSAGLGWRGGAVPMAQTPGKEAESGRSGDLSELSEVVKLLWRAEEDRRAEERHPASGRGKGGVLARCHVQIGDTPELGASKGMEAEVGDTPSTIRVY